MEEGKGQDEEYGDAGEYMQPAHMASGKRLIRGGDLDEC
jgi:hypothetical protein